MDPREGGDARPFQLELRKDAAGQKLPGSGWEKVECNIGGIQTSIVGELKRKEEHQHHHPEKMLS